MLLNIVIGAVLILLTTAIHAGGMFLALRSIRRHGMSERVEAHLPRLLRVGSIVLIMYLVAVMEVLAWAVTYLLSNALDGFEKALYFSMVAFTTLGYGDVVLDDKWRLLASLEAVNGIIMFGWSTAIVIATVQHVYFRKDPVKHGRDE
jgi:hypothetical protein